MERKVMHGCWHTEGPRSMLFPLRVVYSVLRFGRIPFPSLHGGDIGVAMGCSMLVMPGLLSQGYWGSHEGNRVGRHRH